MPKLSKLGPLIGLGVLIALMKSGALSGGLAILFFCIVVASVIYPSWKLHGLERQIEDATGSNIIPHNPYELWADVAEQLLPTDPGKVGGDWFELKDGYQPKSMMALYELDPPIFVAVIDISTQTTGDAHQVLRSGIVIAEILTTSLCKKLGRLTSIRALPNPGDNLITFKQEYENLVSMGLLPNTKSIKQFLFLPPEQQQVVSHIMEKQKQGGN